MSESIVKRFIAGAVCPRCAEMDKLRTYSTSEGTFKECVACDYTEKQLAQVELSELDTRVNHLPEEAAADEAVQVVQLLDPRNTK